MIFKRHGYRKVPTKIVVTGDLAAGKAMIGVGKKQLSLLEDFMSFQGLKTHYSTRRYDDNIVIECYKQHNLSEIRIHALGGTRKKRKKAKKECFCSRCFAVGIIDKVYPEELALKKDILDGDTSKSYDYGMAISGSVAPSYDIKACRKDEIYIELNGFYIPPSGWEIYMKGQTVILTDTQYCDYGSSLSSYPSMCCSSPSCIFADITDSDKVNMDCVRVTPIEATGCMKKFLADIEIIADHGQM